MKTKRLISILLCLLMVFTAIPLTAYAESPTVVTVRIGTNDKFTDYALLDNQENKVTPAGCTGTISAKNGGSHIRVYLDNFICDKPVKILWVSNSTVPLYIEYSGNTTVAYEDTEFPYTATLNNYAAFFVLPNVSAYLTGKDASSVLNVSYIQPTEAVEMQPKNAKPIYTGIYTTGSLNFVGKGTVNVDVQTYITEGGNNTGDGDGCISTVGIYAGGAVYFNTSELTDASNLNVNVNAKLAPGIANDGYVCGIQAGAFLNDASAYSMYFGGKGQMNVHTDADEYKDDVQIWNIDARNQKIRFGAPYEGSKFFQGRLNLTSDCSCNKPFRNTTEPTFVAASTSYTKKTVGDRELTYTYSAPQKVNLSLKNKFGFYENVKTSFTGTLSYKNVSGFTVVPDACFIVDYDKDKFAEEPEISFNGNKMTVKVLPCDWGWFYDAFTVRIVGYDTVDKTKSYTFDQIYTLWVSEADVKEFVSVYDMGKELNLNYENYDGYDDYHADPLGYYDPMNNSMQVVYTDYMNGCDFKFANDKITFTTNEDFFNTTGLKFTQTWVDQFNGEAQTTGFSVWGTLPKLNIDTTFVYADYENGAKAATVYKQRFITVKATANAFKNYFIKNKAVSETIASGVNAFGTKIIYSNADNFGLTAKSNNSGMRYTFSLTGTPTKAGKVVVVFEIAKRLSNSKIDKSRYYAEYTVLDSEPIVRDFGTAQIGVAFTKAMDNPVGSISTGGSTLGKTGLSASWGGKTTISGTPTTAGEYYFITDIYDSKEAKHTYYKDIVTVTDPSKAPKITKQPENCEYVVKGPDPVFKVTATGDELTYQWYWGSYKLMNGAIGGWSASGVNTDTLTIKATGSPFGAMAKNEVYCVISNANGEVTTNKVKIIDVNPTFTTQPKNCIVASGSKATFTAVFEKTDGVTYKWYTSDGIAIKDTSTAPAWTVSGSATNTISITPKTPYAYTLSFYCEATYKGVKFMSDTVSMIQPHTCKDSLEKVEGKAATCLLAGRKEHYKCTVCEKLYADAAATKEIEEKDTVIAALGHNWDTGKVTKEATASTKGERTFTCANCGKTRVETFDYVKPETPAFTYGDVDCNGKIEAADARLALRGAVGLKDAGIDLATKTSVNFLAADVDLNGKVESADARLILRYTVKLETKLGK